MFRKLRLKLIVIHLSLIGLMLLSTFIGINWHMNRQVQNRSLALLHNAVQDVDALRTRFSAMDQSNLFYLLIDEHEEVIEKSPNAPHHYEEILSRTLKENKEKGNLRYEEYDLWFIRTEVEGNIMYLFQRNEGNRMMLTSLKETTFIIGAISAVFALLISVVMANRAIRPIVSAWEKQQSFVSDASHELRTPLATLSINLEAVLDSPDETVAEQSEWLINMQNEITRMKNLVNDLLLLARMDEKHENLSRESINLSQLLIKASNPFILMMEEKEITFEQKIEKDVEILGIENHLHQLIIILLDNAIKHTPSNGMISLQLKSSKEKISIVVKDTGVGISKEHQEHIFERFYRADTARNRTSGGAGLGLSIAKTIVNNHKGKLHVESAVGSGTTFEILLPKS